jgi:hypothetical protein
MHPYSARDSAAPQTRQAFTSGFGAVMEQENDLLSSTDECLGTDIGSHAASVNRILREQRTRVGVNVSLLEQCYETLPSPARFEGLQGRFGPPTTASRAGPALENDGLLQDLVARHLHLRDNIELLAAHDPQGPSIMAEVARNHEEMAWMLTALLKEDESVRDRMSPPIIAVVAPGVTPGTTEGNWENEGGASRVVPRVPDASANRRV